jgi:quinone-modifying oxidoreductase subunit QmoA
MADIQPLERQLEADILVVGGGISGMTTAIEAAEVGKRVLLVEKLPSLGGRVASMNQYFPKLCPPTCGVEINLRRIRANANIRVLTTTEVSAVSGSKGSYQATLKVNPRFVNDKCTCCGECEKVCEIERVSDFDYGMGKTKAIYLPHMMAYPPRYVVDPGFSSDPRMQKCADACQYGAVELDMKPVDLNANVGAIVWATGWKPYDASKIDNLGFGRFANVVTNVMMERLAAPNGPTSGRILRPSDGKEPKRVGFVQCAGSRDQNHLPYCSAVCCLASMKQATYVREQYPDTEVHIFYIDVRSPGRLEDFYVARQTDDKLHFHRGKVARITEAQSGNLILEAENTLTGQITKTEVDMAVLATGMVPNALDDKPSGATLDDFGFIVEDLAAGVVGAGTVTRPFDVSASIQDATGAALKAILVGARR